MDGTHWLPVVVALIGGGAAGAIINTLVSAYRSRRQPVGRRVDILPVFRPSGTSTELPAVIAVSHEGTTITFGNLFLAEVQVVNRGNQDITEFTFGVTLGTGDRCIHVAPTPPDRHHSSTLHSAPNPETPRAELDFSLRPFNRGDSYSFKLYVVVPEGATEPGELRLGSPSPVTFVAMPTVRETLARAASEVSIGIGPIRVRLDR